MSRNCLSWDKKNNPDSFYEYFKSSYPIRAQQIYYASNPLCQLDLIYD